MLLAGNAYLFLTRDNAEGSLITIREEKAFLRNELKRLEAELEQVNKLNIELSTELKARQAELKERIASLQEALENNKLTARQLELAKAEVSGLRNFVGAYLEEIGMLRKQKDRLLAENEDLRSKMNVEKQRNEELSSRNMELAEKISEAAMLSAEKVSVTTFYFRADGDKVIEDQSSRAARVNKLRVEFAFYPNAVAEEGHREVYFCIYGPQGGLLRLEDGDTPSFRDSDGKSVPCTAKTTIFYSRSNPVYAVELQQSSALQKGPYRVQLFTDGYQIGEGNFSLK